AVGRQPFRGGDAGRGGDIRPDPGSPDGRDGWERRPRARASGWAGGGIPSRGAARALSSPPGVLPPRLRGRPPTPPPPSRRAADAVPSPRGVVRPGFGVSPPTPRPLSRRAGSGRRTTPPDHVAATSGATPKHGRQTAGARQGGPRWARGTVTTTGPAPPGLLL